MAPREAMSAWTFPQSLRAPMTGVSRYISTAQSQKVEVQRRVSTVLGKRSLSPFDPLNRLVVRTSASAPLLRRASSMSSNMKWHRNSNKDIHLTSERFEGTDPDDSVHENEHEADGVAPWIDDDIWIRPPQASSQLDNTCDGEEEKVYLRSSKSDESLLTTCRLEGQLRMLAHEDSEELLTERSTTATVSEQSSGRPEPNDCAKLEQQSKKAKCTDSSRKAGVSFAPARKVRQHAARKTEPAEVETLPLDAVGSHIRIGGGHIRIRKALHMRCGKVFALGQDGIVYELRRGRAGEAMIGKRSYNQSVRQMLE